LYAALTAEAFGKAQEARHSGFDKLVFMKKIPGEHVDKQVFWSVWMYCAPAGHDVMHSFPLMSSAERQADTHR